MDLYQKQFKNEIEFYKLNIGKAKDDVLDKKNKGNENLSTTTNVLLKHYVNRLSPHIKEYKTKINKRRKFYDLFMTLDVNEISVLIIDAVLCNISNEKIKYSDIRKSITNRLHMQFEIKYNIKKNVNLKYVIARIINKAKTECSFNKSSVNYRSTFNAPEYLFRKTIAPILKYRLVKDTSLGALMLDLVIRNTDLVEKYTYKQKTYLRSTTTTQQHLIKRENINYLAKLSPLPMITEPIKWTAKQRGGFLLQTHQLIKSNDREHAKDVEFNSKNLSKIYKALNTLQSTALRINKNVYHVYQKLFDSQSEMGGLPDQKFLDRKTMIEQQTDADVKRVLFKQYIEYKNTHFGKTLQTARLLNHAKQRLKYNKIYVPYNLDSRGRFYALCELSAQNCDLARGLLEFAEGKKLGNQSAVYNLAIHGANTAGNDKISNNDRYDWVKQNTSIIVNCAMNPLENTQWQSIIGGVEIENPVQFLAFCFAWTDYIKNGLDSICYLPIVFDATCSGLQHCSALLLNRSSAKLVNLTKDSSNNSSKPYDVYTTILNDVIKKVKKDAKSKGANIVDDTGNIKYSISTLAQSWLDFGLTRSTVKRPAMTLIYNATKSGFIDQIDQDVIRPAKLKDFFNTNSNKNLILLTSGNQFSKYLADIIWTVSHKILSSLSDLKEYLKLLVEEKPNEFFTYTTVTGLKVKNSYPKLRELRVTELISKRKIWFNNLDYESNPDKSKIARAIVPNFIHSLDAAHLTLALNELHDVDVVAIHDCVGVHPSEAVKLHKILRSTFVNLYSNIDSFLETLSTVIKLKKTNDFNINEVMKSKYFFS